MNKLITINNWLFKILMKIFVEQILLKKLRAKKWNCQPKISKLIILSKNIIITQEGTIKNNDSKILIILMINLLNDSLIALSKIITINKINLNYKIYLFKIKIHKNNKLNNNIVF